MFLRLSTAFLLSALPALGHTATRVIRRVGVSPTGAALIFKSDHVAPPVAESLTAARVASTAVPPPKEGGATTAACEDAFDNADGFSYDALIRRDGACVPTLSTKRVWWLHFPMTGASFGTTVATAVKSGTRSTRNYQALTDNDDPSEVVVMFREPKQRLASGFAWLRKNRQSGKNDWKNDWGWGSTAREQALVEIDKHANFSQSDYLQSFHTCQLNMILGHGCYSKKWHPGQEEQKAEALIDKFLFVGLHSEWKLSICLFNYITTGKRFVEEFQLGKNPSSKVTEYNTEGFQHDQFDERQYKRARTRFYADLEKHGVSDESCKVTKDHKSATNWLTRVRSNVALDF